MQDTRETIMAVARSTVQAHGYSGLSFREIAKAIGVKSASIHYHFPTKGDLGAAVARRYREDAAEALDRILADDPDPATCLRRYIAIFRRTLEHGNRMCLCGFLAAEHDDLPGPVRAEVKNFAEVNTAWLARILSAARPDADRQAIQAQALAIFAAIGGAQLLARSRNDPRVYDDVIEAYRSSGLIPRL